MIRDIREHSFTIFLDQRFSESEKLHIVVLEPVFPLSEMYSIDILVVFDFPSNPFSYIGRDPTIWRIPNHYHHRLISLDLIGESRLIGDRFEETK